MSLLLLFQPSREVKLISNPVKIIAANEYRIEFMIWMDTGAQVQATLLDSAGNLQGQSYQRYVPSSTWMKYTMTVTATSTDNAGKFVVRFETTANTIRFDDAKMYNLTLENEDYRVMRIQGSVKPGGFIQTLTLREKTAAEIA